jgi:hypothetical protein
MLKRHLEVNTKAINTKINIITNNEDTLPEELKCRDDDTTCYNIVYVDKNKDGAEQRNNYVETEVTGTNDRLAPLVIGLQQHMEYFRANNGIGMKNSKNQTHSSDVSLSLS